MASASCRGLQALANEAGGHEDDPRPNARAVPSPPGPSYVRPRPPCHPRASRSSPQEVHHGQRRQPGHAAELAIPNPRRSLSSGVLVQQAAVAARAEDRFAVPRQRSRSLGAEGPGTPNGVGARTGPPGLSCSRRAHETSRNCLRRAGTATGGGEASALVTGRYPDRDSTLGNGAQTPHNPAPMPSPLGRLSVCSRSSAARRSGAAWKWV